MEKYDDLVFCRERTSQARSVYAPKNSVVIFSHTKSITYKYKVYNLYIIYFQFHLETNKFFILNTFFNSLTG